ncbi:MAG: hypothetical protein HOP02_12490 [Methylococcaceae bacterium]|nr:hypothetical protein [Methylococcaceae bacterium]
MGGYWRTTAPPPGVSSSSNYASDVYTGSGAAINNNGTWQDNNANLARIYNGYGGAASSFNNTGTYSKNGAGTTDISLAFNNTSNGAGTGIVNVDNGKLKLSNGINGATGTVNIHNNASLVLGAASSTATLTNSSSAGIDLGANNLTVYKDYDNANFGTGNSFNANANVTRTSGQIGG